MKGQEWRACSYYAELDNACQTNCRVGWSNPEIITTNQQCHQRLCLEAWHKNSTHFLLNHKDGRLLPENYLHLINSNKLNAH